MVYDVIMSICMNISLLIVLALMLTKIEFVKVLLLNGEEEERNDRKTGTRKVRNQLVLGGIFGIFCVISDYIGIQVEGALPNARVIGVLSAGFLGGPVSGMTTAVIASIHRYLIFPERISTLACVLAAILHGGDRLLDWICKKGQQAVFQLVPSCQHFCGRSDPYDTDTDFNETV